MQLTCISKELFYIFTCWCECSAYSRLPLADDKDLYPCVIIIKQSILTLHRKLLQNPQIISMLSVFTAIIYFIMDVWTNTWKHLLFKVGCLLFDKLLREVKSLFDSLQYCRISALGKSRQGYLIWDLSTTLANNSWGKIKEKSKWKQLLGWLFCLT